MTPLFAELDWGVVTTTVGTTLVTVAGGIGALARWTVNRFEKMQADRIAHEQDMMTRFEKMQTETHASSARLYQEMMVSERDKTKVLMDINQKGLEAVSALTREIATQGNLLGQLTAAVSGTHHEPQEPSPRPPARR